MLPVNIYKPIIGGTPDTDEVSALRISDNATGYYNTKTMEFRTATITDWTVDYSGTVAIRNAALHNLPTDNIVETVLHSREAYINDNGTIKYCEEAYSRTKNLYNVNETAISSIAELLAITKPTKSTANVISALTVGNPIPFVPNAKGIAIPCSKGDTFSIKSFGTIEAARRYYVECDADGKILAARESYIAAGETITTSHDNCAYLFIEWCLDTTDNSQTVVIEGSTAPTEYVPYIKRIFQAGYPTEISSANPVQTDVANAREIDYKIAGNTKQAIVIDGKEYIVPDGYTLLEYIESSGTQYIDTGVALTDTSKTFNFEVLGQQVNAGSSNYSWWMGQFALSKSIGAYADNTPQYTFYPGGCTYYQNGAQISTPSGGDKYAITKVISSLQGNASATYNWLLFARATNQLATNTKIFNFKAWDGSNLIRNFVPAQRISDSVIGMYDTVSNTFFTNAGTGDFIAGKTTKTVRTANEFNYVDFFDNYQTVTGSSVGRFPIKLEPNTQYVCKINVQKPNGEADIFVVSGSAIVWSPSTGDNGVLVNNPRTVTTDSDGYLCVGMYFTPERVEVAETEFINGNAKVMLVKGSTAPTEYIPYTIEVPLFHYRGVGDKTENCCNEDVSAWKSENPYTTYRWQKFTDTDEEYYIYLFDRDTSIDISGCHFGFTSEPVSTSSTFVWLVNVGTILQRGVSNFKNNIYMKYMVCYPNTVQTLQKILSRFKVMLVKGSTAPTEYIPYGYKLTELLAQNCGMVDLGTLNWTRQADGNYPIFGATLSDTASKSQGAVNTLYTDAYTVKPTVDTASGFKSRDYDRCITQQSNSTSNNIMVQDARFTDAATFKAAMSGKYLYYQRTTDSTWTAPTITPIYTPAPVYKVGTYTDTLLSAGLVNRKVGVKVLDGTEDWYTTDTSDYYTAINDRVWSTVPLICSHFSRLRTYMTINVGFYIADMPSSVINMTTWKAYLAAQYAAGTPVTIYYPLATPTTETIEVPTISTVKGTNIFDVETEVNPSNKTICYVKRCK